MNNWIYLILIMALWNIVTFALYGIDKRKAMKSKRRISGRYKERLSLLSIKEASKYL